jgi:hypothetical protein
MQCILREKLAVLAAALADVSEVYRTDTFRFVDTYLEWLKNAEQQLLSTRSPICVLLHAEVTSVASVLDGYRPEHLEFTRSLRKVQRAAAAQSLERVSREIYVNITRIDGQLDEMEEKLSHGVAVLGTKNPDLYGRITADQDGVDLLWAQLSLVPETVPLYSYVSARLSLIDRNYILLSIAQKIVNNRMAVPVEPSTAIH